MSDTAIRTTMTCRRCHAKPHIPGLTVCAECRDWWRGYLRERYYQRKEAGLCRNCNNAVAPNSTVFCVKCLDRHRRGCVESRVRGILREELAATLDDLHEHESP